MFFFFSMRNVGLKWHIKLKKKKKREGIGCWVGCNIKKKYLVHVENLDNFQDIYKILNICL